MRTLLRNSATNDASDPFDGSDSVVASSIIEVRNEGGWTGSLKFEARLNGRGREGATDYAGTIAVTNLVDGSVVDGDTGITGAGLYRIDTAGLEVRCVHTRTTGAVSVYEYAVLG